MRRPRYGEVEQDERPVQDKEEKTVSIFIPLSAAAVGSRFKGTDGLKAQHNAGGAEALCTPQRPLFSRLLGSCLCLKATGNCVITSLNALASH